MTRHGGSISTPTPLHPHHQDLVLIIHHQKNSKPKLMHHYNAHSIQLPNIVRSIPNEKLSKLATKAKFTRVGVGCRTGAFSGRSAVGEMDNVGRLLLQSARDRVDTSPQQRRRCTNETQSGGRLEANPVNIAKHSIAADSLALSDGMEP